MRQLVLRSGKIQEARWIFLLQGLALVEQLVGLVGSLKRKTLA